MNKRSKYSSEFKVKVAIAALREQETLSELVNRFGESVMIITKWKQDGITLGQVKVNQKSNEIKAIPELLNALDLENCIVIIDAMGCQTAISEKIIERKADYVLHVKNNQKNLYKKTAVMV